MAVTRGVAPSANRVKTSRAVAIVVSSSVESLTPGLDELRADPGEDG